MMVLDTCHISVSMNIDGSKKSFVAMNLKDYPGENVAALAAAALTYIKVMNTGYAIDIKVESSILKKVDSTSSSYFNRNIHNELSRVKKMELKYTLKYPKLLKADPEYSALGLIVLCGFIQEEYSTLFAEQEWSALVEALPSTNNSLIDTRNSTKKAVNSEGRTCFACGSNTHLRIHPNCAKFDSSKFENNTKNKVSTTPSNTVNDNDNNSNKRKPSTPRPKDAWNCIHPADNNQTVTDQA